MCANFERPGKDTSEFSIVQGEGKWAALVTFFGIFVAAIPELLEILQGFASPDDLWYRLIGAIMAVTSLLYRAWIKREYVRGRPIVKKAEAKAAERI